MTILCPRRKCLDDSLFPLHLVSMLLKDKLGKPRAELLFVLDDKYQSKYFCFLLLLLLLTYSFMDVYVLRVRVLMTQQRVLIEEFVGLTSVYF